MRRTVLFSLVTFLLFAFFTSVAGRSQTPADPCPVHPVHFSPDGVNVRVENTSGKTIVGMTWFAAVADATEHWNWILGNFRGPYEIREFNWNKEVKPAAKKTLSWDFTDLDFHRATGGAFILGSVLYSDGTRWEGNPSDHQCQVVWLNSHRKAFTLPEELPRLRGRAG